MATRLFLSSAVLAFVCMHTPIGPVAAAALFYLFILVAEKLYRVFIVLAKILCFAYVAFLFVHSLTLYLPPEIPTPGRKDALWLGRAELFMLQSFISI